VHGARADEPGANGDRVYMCSVHDNKHTQHIHNTFLLFPCNWNVPPWPACGLCRGCCERNPHVCPTLGRCATPRVRTVIDVEIVANTAFLVDGDGRAQSGFR
jgi:hypothetical protein